MRYDTFGEGNEVLDLSLFYQQSAAFAQVRAGEGGGAPAERRPAPTQQGGANWQQQ